MKWAVLHAIACSQKTHPYRDINILASIVRVTTPLYFASNEA
jgi:hypothetical protein